MWSCHLQNQCKGANDTNEMKSFFELSRSRILAASIDDNPPTDRKLTYKEYFHGNWTLGDNSYQYASENRNSRISMYFHHWTLIQIARNEWMHEFGFVQFNPIKTALISHLALLALNSRTEVILHEVSSQWRRLVLFHSFLWPCLFNQRFCRSFASFSRDGPACN